MRKFHSLLFINLFLLSALSYGQTEQDTSWKSGGFIGITFSQTNLSNWSAGGENSLSLAGNANLFSNYAKDKTEWANELILNYSMVNTKSGGLIKSDDRIELNSKVGRKLSEKWLFSFLLNFKSQFAEGYNYPDDSIVVSNFFAPAYLTLGLGFTWKPVEYFEVFLSPVTAKFTFVNDQTLSDAGAYGVDSGSTIRTEIGAYVNMSFKKEIMKNVELLSRLELFNGYADKDKENAKKIDVNWDTYLYLKVNDFLTASLNVVVIYDADVIERTQFKEIFGIGLGYKFGAEAKK